MNKKKEISVTRIVKLDKHHDVIVGQDLSKIFEDGMVYDVRKVMGEFVITPIGKSAHVAVAKKRFPSFNSDPRTKAQILMDGSTYITEEELKLDKKYIDSEY